MSIRSLLEYANGDKKFAAWLGRADRRISRRGISLLDLADRDWRSAYDDGFDPSDEADDALEEEGFPFDED